MTAKYSAMREMKRSRVGSPFRSPTASHTRPIGSDGVDGVLQTKKEQLPGRKRPEFCLCWRAPEAYFVEPSINGFVAEELKPTLVREGNGSILFRHDRDITPVG